MKLIPLKATSFLSASLLCALLPTAWAASLAGHGTLAGTVSGTKPDALAVVRAYNAERDVAYVVYVVDGKYRATNLLPGDYEISVQPAVGQLQGFAKQTLKRAVKADVTATANFVLGKISPIIDYVGGVRYDGDPRYPDGKILPYDKIYPPGPGRDILERTCNACHSVSFISYNAPRSYSGGRAEKDRIAWAASVDRMHKPPAFGRAGKAPMFDPALLPAEDREILIDYLATNFGVGSEPRVVQLEAVPKLDRAALSRAMFIEYNYREPKGKYDVWPWPHQVDFDQDGNVWLAYTGCCIVRFDPRTGESRAFEGHGGGHGIAVDQHDGTVWYSGDAVRRLDPKTGLVDNWKHGGDRMLGSNTQIFDSHGNLWLSYLAAGGLGKWDRKSDSILWYEVPVVASRPYGIIVDNLDKVWWADYHNGGVTRFDPVTQQFKHFPLVKENTASSIRRLGVDSKNNIWAGTWASVNYIAKLYRLNPDTGEVKEWALDDLPYAATYNAEPDSQDNIWLSNDNYLSKFDTTVERFVHYPIPVRSDTLKTTITRDDGVWFFYRNAGKYENYGGTAVVLYPDKENIPTLAAYHRQGNQGYRLGRYQGPPAPPVKGGDRVGSTVAQNADSYARWAGAAWLVSAPDKSTVVAATPTASSSAPKQKVANVEPAVVAAGKRIHSSNCIACHTLDKGGAHGVGPNLWGVLGSKAGSKTDFSYSAAMEESGIIWTREALAKFIAAPSKMLPGTIMAAVGVSKEEDRAALLAYLQAETTATATNSATQQDNASQRE